MELKNFVAECKPSFASINYAIKSQNIEMVKEMLEKFYLRASLENLIVASATGNSDVFNYLITRGVKPEGSLVLKMAVKSGSEPIVHNLVTKYNYRITQKNLDSAKHYGHKNLEKLFTTDERFIPSDKAAINNSNRA